MKFKIPQWIWHAAIVVVMVFVFYPTAKAYVSSGQPTGGDLPNSLTYVEHFRKHLTFPPSSWQPFWYSGISTVKSYPWLHFYFMQPLVRVFDIASAVEIYSLGAMFLFFFFSYLLFNFLSKKPLVSLFFVLLLFYTRGTLAALFWSGFVNAADTQFFLPLCLLLTLKYSEAGNRKYYVAGAILSGISILAHPMVGIFFVLIPCLIALLFAKEEGFSFWQKLKSLFSFGLIAILIAGVSLWPLALLFLETSSVRACINCVWKLSDILTWFNPLVFYIFAGFLVLGTPFLFLRKEKKDINLFLILFFILVGFLIIFISVTYNLNIIPLVGGALWPERMAWAISLILLTIAALLVRQILASLEKGFILKLFSSLAVIFAIAFLMYSSPREMFSLLKTHPGVYPFNSIDLLGKYKTKDPSNFVPSWLDTNDFNHRIDSLVYEVYHWWNAVFDIPNTRGYAQFTKGRFEDWNAWLWAAQTDNLKIGQEASKNSAKYLLDWFAISYLERNRESFTDRGFYAQYLLDSDIVKRSDQVGELYFHQLNPEVTSPIISATNAPTVLFVGDKIAYDDFTRALALANANSQKIVPISGPRQLEKLSKVNLFEFDAIILSAYEHQDLDDSWKAIEDYVEKGGRLFIETGIEVRESESDKLPDTFPITKTRRAGLGDSWQLEFADHQLNTSIHQEDFSPLLYQTDPWKLSFAPDINVVKKGAVVVLSQSGKPILVEGNYGQGKVIWSGMNLTYHAKNYNNVAEGKFLYAILLYLAGEPSGKVEQEVFRPKPEKIVLNAKNPKGVLFKEVYDSGWKARYSIGGGGWRKTKIYPAGPGFMYARLPESKDGVKVELLYRGSFSAWLFFLVGVGTVIWGIRYLVAGNKVVLKGGPLRNIKNKMAHWWEKEEE